MVDLKLEIQFRGLWICYQSVNGIKFIPIGMPWHFQNYCFTLNVFIYLLLLIADCNPYLCPKVIHLRGAFYNLLHFNLFAICCCERLSEFKTFFSVRQFGMTE
jgi:hypothetical protein